LGNTCRPLKSLGWIIKLKWWSGLFWPVHFCGTELGGCGGKGASVAKSRDLIRSAMRAGVSDHVWSIEEIVGLLDFVESKSN
jgi:hypothetical protein